MYFQIVEMNVFNRMLFYMYFQLCEDLFNRIRDSNSNEVTYSVEVSLSRRQRPEPGCTLSFQIHYNLFITEFVITRIWI